MYRPPAGGAAALEGVARHWLLNSAGRGRFVGHIAITLSHINHYIWNA